MIGRDIRFAFRAMRQTPMVSGVALLSLALGIGANVAIFSLVNALLLKPLPVREPERLVLLTEPQPEFPERPPASYWTNTQWEFLRDHGDFLDGMLATGAPIFNLNAAGERRPAYGLYVSGGFFTVLGVAPHIGRVFTTDDDLRGGGAAGPTAVISYAFWQREFGGDPSVLGRSLSLDGHAFTVVGVTPPDFTGLDVGRSFDVAVPIGSEPIIRGAESTLDRRGSWWLRIFGRLAPGQSIAQAEAQLHARQQAMREATIPSDWRPSDAGQYLGPPFTFTPAATGVSDLRLRYTRPLFVLLGIVGFVLVIACANMANLLLARSTARRSELAIRLSLGASRGQLVRQLLIESLLLSSLGAASGLVIAIWASHALVGMLSMSNSIVSYDLSIDWRVLAFTTSVGVLTALLFGVAPALLSTRVRPAETLRDHARGVLTGGSRFSFGHLLVGAQIALSFVLVFGAGLFVRTLIQLTAQNVGFQTGQVLIASVDLRRTTFSAAERPPLFEHVREQVAAVPGVQGAALSVVTPISQSMWNTTVEADGYEPSAGERNTSYLNAITPGYLSLMGTPILTGRDVAATDRPGSPRVALVNEAFARKYFKDANPLGRTFVRRGPSATTRIEVIGLVADAKYANLRERPQPTIYLPWLQEQPTGSTALLSVRLSGSTEAFRSTVLGAITDVEKEAVVSFRTFDSDIRAATRQERMIASLSGVFGGLALLLAAIGLYGVTAYSVTRRRNEIGVRLALGAERGTVMRLVLGHVWMVTACGLVAGVIVAVSAGRFVDALLYGLTTADTTMLATTAIILAIAAGVAGYVPARRAARVDPMIALREQ